MLNFDKIVAAIYSPFAVFLIFTFLQQLRFTDWLYTISTVKIVKKNKKKFT